MNLLLLFIEFKQFKLYHSFVKFFLKKLKVFVFFLLLWCVKVI